MKSKLLTQAVVSLILSLFLSLVGVWMIFGELPIIEWLIASGVLYALMLLSIFIAFLLKQLTGAVYTFLMSFYSMTLVCGILALPIYALVNSPSISDMNWKVIFGSFWGDTNFYLIWMALFLVYAAIYYTFINHEEIVSFLHSFGRLKGKGKLGQIEANLENSRWMRDDERDKIFKSCKYSDLAEMKQDGVPIRAKFNGKNDMDITLQSPCHGLIS